MTAEIGKIMQQINAMGVSVILVEQNAMLALTLAQHSYVLETGSLVLQAGPRSAAGRGCEKGLPGDLITRLPGPPDPARSATASGRGLWRS